MNTLLKPHSVSILLLASDHLVVGANVREGDLLTAFLLVSAKPFLCPRQPSFHGGSGGIVKDPQKFLDPSDYIVWTFSLLTRKKTKRI